MVNPIYRKTEAGLDEIKTRARKLDHKLRALLLIVNGERREQELLSQLDGMGVGSESLDQLAQMALVEAVPEAARTQPATSKAAPDAEDSNLFSLYAMRRVEAPGSAQAPVAALAPASADTPHSEADIRAYQRLYHFFTDVVSQHLGLRGYVMQVKVEKATDLPSLIALRDPLHAALLKAKGEITAQAITGQLDELVKLIGMDEGG
ncbi:hypothetical protein LMG31506_00380 [Cupriavidus yeoncheonensis]|uniref:Proline-rich protein n=1 Tax=Cupriavidus yeoncheonensis TaxID=1462994 RepID=A0A916IR25_9BURK|nr:hypothetical protein [Cupriavidus yeoncheonensis]CAG2127203.1 hypothetical protein LMG31506_00380 [Cupriavidus yeoncheonensis]